MNSIEKPLFPHESTPLSVVDLWVIIDSMKTPIHNFLLELFYVLTGAILISVCLEIIWPGLVLAYLNLNYFLLSWLVVGIIIVIT